MNIYKLGLRQAKNSSDYSTYFKCNYVINDSHYFRICAIRIVTGAITAGALIAMILCDAVIYAAYELIYTRY